MNWLRKFFHRLNQELAKKAWVRFTFYPVLFLLIAAALVVTYWSQLSNLESESATIRNFAIVLFAIIGLGLAIWRGAVADKQAETAQQSLLNERYQKGAEMLGSNLLSVRLGGIYALKFLAQEHPKRYHVLIMQLLCGFVRHPPEQTNQPSVTPQFAREDVRAAMQAIGERSQTDIALEREADYVPNLRGTNLQEQVLYGLNLTNIEFGFANLAGASLIKANLKGAYLWHADLSGAHLPGADFSRASLTRADLTGVQAFARADFSKADLSNANLTDANFAGAILTDAILTGTNLSGATFYRNGLLAKGLTQKQIAFAKLDPEDKLPILDGLKDVDTGEPIEWSKRPQIK